MAKHGHAHAARCLFCSGEVELENQFLAQNEPELRIGHNQRTTNPIESVFATVRLRTYKTRGHGSALACETMVFKLMERAAKHWRLLNGSKLLPDVIAGVKFIDGEKENAA